MNNYSMSEIVWHKNPVFIQLLGLSPLLAITDTSTKGIALGGITALVGVLAALIHTQFNTYVRSSLRYIWLAFLVAALTTFTDILLQAYQFALHKELGLYLPLVACNTALLLHILSTKKTANTPTHLAQLSSTFFWGLGIILAFTLFSLLREFFVYGTLFRDWDLLSNNATIAPDIAQDSRSLQFIHFAKLQPGAFILMGLTLAGVQFFSIYIKQNQPDDKSTDNKVMRARVTGKL